MGTSDCEGLLLRIGPGMVELLSSNQLCAQGAIQSYVEELQRVRGLRAGLQRMELHTRDECVANLKVLARCRATCCASLSLGGRAVLSTIEVWVGGRAGGGGANGEDFKSYDHLPKYCELRCVTSALLRDNLPMRQRKC